VKNWGFILLLFWVLPVLAQQQAVLLPPANGVYVADPYTVYVHSLGSVYVHNTLYIAKPAIQKKKIQTALQPLFEGLAAVQIIECASPAANNTARLSVAGYKPKPYTNTNAQVPALAPATVSMQQAPPSHHNYPNYPGLPKSKFPTTIPLQRLWVAQQASLNG
jgi:hypothetical protein